MKRIYFIFMLLGSLISMNTTAQEIRGVETTIVTYEGKNHEGVECYWAAFEFVNKNSISVSVDAELFRSKPNEETYERQYSYAGTVPKQDNSHIYPRLISAKSFVLQPGESYLWKHETEQYYSKTGRDEKCTNAFISRKEYWPDAQNYFVKYKAYKLQ